MHGGVFRLTETVAHWKVDEQTSRRVHQGGDVAPRRDGNGRYASFFYNSCNQTHGLVIEWSSRDRDQQIDAILFQLFDQSGRRFAGHLAAVIGAPHKAAPMPFGDRANFTRIRQFL